MLLACPTAERRLVAADLHGVRLPRLLNLAIDLTTKGELGCKVCGNGYPTDERERVVGDCHPGDQGQERCVQRPRIRRAVLGQQQSDGPLVLSARLTPPIMRMRFARA